MGQLNEYGGDVDWGEVGSLDNSPITDMANANANEPKIETDIGDEPKIETEIETDIGDEPKIETEIGDETETETEIEDETETETEIEDETETEIEDETETETEIEKKGETKSNGDKRSGVDPKSKNTFVPRKRLNKEVEKRRALEVELSELRSQQSVAPVTTEVGEPATISLSDFKAMSSAIIDGDDEVAMEKFTKMLASQTSVLVKEARDTAITEARSEVASSRDNEKLIFAATELAALYPELDGSSDEADVGLIEEVVDIRDSYESRGLSPSDALHKAVKLVALDNGLVDRTRVKSISASPNKKRKTSISRKMELSEKERGKLPGDAASNSRVRLDIANMSNSDFDKLSKEALAKARGDFL